MSNNVGSAGETIIEMEITPLTSSPGNDLSPPDRQTEEDVMSLADAIECDDLQQLKKLLGQTDSSNSEQKTNTEPKKSIPVYLKQISLVVDYQTLSVRSKRGKTALHLTIEKGYDGFSQSIIEKFPQMLLETDKRGDTPLHYIIKYERTKLCSNVKDFLAEEIIHKKNEKSVTAMHSAAIERRPEIMKILLEKKGDPRILTSNLHTPLHFAAQYGSEECVKLLLAADKDVENLQTNAQEGAEKYVNMRTKHGRTALMFAAKQGFLEICKLLKSTDANLQCVEGKTALHYALNKGLERVVFYIVERLQTDCLIKDKDGNLPLHLSVCGRKECFSYMLQKTDSDALSDDVVAELVKLAATKSLKNIQIMADNEKFRERLITYRDPANNNLLHLTVVRESYSSALALIRNTKISKTSKNSDDNTPLHLLIMHSGRAMSDQEDERRQVQTALLRSAQDVVNSANKHGETPLYLASKFGAHDILCSLLQKKPVLKFTTPQESAIHIAAQKGHDACLKMLLRSARSKDFIKLRRMKVHPLHLSSKHGHLECAKLLLTSSFGDQNFKENLTSKAENGHYPVDKAFAGMHGELFTFLLIQMAKDDKDEEFSTRLHGYFKKSMKEIDMGNEQQKAKLLAFRSAVLEAVIESNWCNVAFNTQFCGNIRQPLTANEEEVHNKIKPCDSFARLISNRPDLACRALDKHITLLPGGNRELHDYTPFEFIYYRTENSKVMSPFSEIMPERQTHDLETSSNTCNVSTTRAQSDVVEANDPQNSTENSELLNKTNYDSHDLNGTTETNQPPERRGSSSVEKKDSWLVRRFYGLYGKRDAKEEENSNCLESNVEEFSGISWYKDHPLQKAVETCRQDHGRVLRHRLTQ
ncbi:ankyrin-1 [Hyalella azteca]|uniref:Ankyrin-1 n=1 Tax=Hyalella azteca TaxID=294128 RepID=A0A8B7P914_HYAAZ|nr:ankyrin-1 [Hyalella azteca]